MSPLTRVEAMKKMEAFKVKIGFPDKWIDYSTLKVEKGQALMNFYASNAFGFQLDLNRCDIFSCVDVCHMGLHSYVCVCVFNLVSIPFHLISFHSSPIIFFAPITTPSLCEHFFSLIASPHLSPPLPYPLSSLPHLTMSFSLPHITLHT